MLKRKRDQFGKWGTIEIWFPVRDFFPSGYESKNLLYFWIKIWKRKFNTLTVGFLNILNTFKKICPNPTITTLFTCVM